MNPRIYVSSVSIKPQYTAVISHFNMCDYAARKGIEADLNPRLDESLLCRARIRSCAEFFYQPEYTHLMTVDDDLLCPSDTIVKLVEADKDIIG